MSLIKFAQPLYDIQEFIYERIGREIPDPKDRKLLQWIGTDWGRAIDPDLWTGIWKAEVQRVLSKPASLVVNDDVRFDNEAHAVRELGGIVVQVVAPAPLRLKRGKYENRSHASEKGISGDLIDHYLPNTGTLSDLNTNLTKLVARLS